MANKPIDKVQMENDLFLEMLEVYINSILYLREVYPSAIFRKRRIYQTAAYISIYPKLNEYLLNTLKQAQLLKAANELYQVDVIIYQRDFELFGTPDDEEVLERYVFRVEESDNNKKDLVAWIQDFEENLRSGLCQLDRISKKLKPLKSDSIGFRIELKTTQSAYHDITQKDNTQTKNFSWVKAAENKSSTLKLNPILQAEPFSLLLFTSKHRYPME